jgi:AcrR family transcriptional regulator
LQQTEIAIDNAEPCGDVRTGPWMSPHSRYADAVASAGRQRGRPSGRTKAQTRAQIVDSALRCFGMHGYGGATNKMIADGAGLTTGALYRHFKSKSDLYFAVFSEVNNQTMPRLGAAVSGASTLREAVLSAVEVARLLNAENPFLAPFFSTLRFDIQRYAELAHIQHIPTVPRVDELEHAAMAALPDSRPSPAALRCYTEILRAIILGIGDFAIHARSPQRFEALIGNVEAVVLQGAAHAERSGTAVAGVDYREVGRVGDATGG